MSDETRRNRIRIILLDSLELFRASLGSFLASDSEFEVAGECGTAEEALELLKHAAVDVLLLDFDVRTEQGEDLLSVARRAGYQGRFLIMAGAPDVRKSAMALKGGVSGIFLKSETPDRLIHAIRLVVNGELWVDPRVIHLLADQSIDRRRPHQTASSLLDDRERNVLLGVTRGLSNRKIAESMGLSESSIKNVLQKLFARTAVRTRSQLVRLALEGSLGAASEFTDAASR